MFEVGDIVRLKNGHTPMRVIGGDHDTTRAVYCNWYRDSAPITQKHDTFVLVTDPDDEFSPCHQWQRRLMPEEHARLDHQRNMKQDEDMTRDSSSSHDTYADVITAIHLSNGVRFYAVSYGESAGPRFTLMAPASVDYRVGQRVFAQVAESFKPATVREIDVPPEFGQGIQRKWIIGCAEAVSTQHAQRTAQYAAMVRALVQGEAERRAKEILESMPGAHALLEAVDGTPLVDLGDEVVL